MPKKSQSGTFLVAQQMSGTLFKITFKNGHGHKGEGCLEVKDPAQKMVQARLAVGKRHFAGNLPLNAIGRGHLLGLALADGKRFVQAGSNGTRLIIQSAVHIKPQEGVRPSLTVCRKQKRRPTPRTILEEVEEEA